MLKKIFIIISLVICAIPLSSCGRNTNGWPTIELPFDKDDIVKISLFHSKKDEEDVNLTVTSANLIDYLYSSVAYLYEEKTTKKSRIEKKPYIKIELIYYYFKADFFTEYKLTFYNYGVSTTYVVFNNDYNNVHYTPANTEVTYLHFIQNMEGETK